MVFASSRRMNDAEGVPESLKPKLTGAEGVPESLTCGMTDAGRSRFSID